MLERTLNTSVQSGVLMEKQHAPVLMEVSFPKPALLEFLNSNPNWLVVVDVSKVGRQ